MKIPSYIKFLVQHYLFWIGLFFINRFIFLSYNLKKLIELPLLEILKSFFYGLYLDHSSACYLLAFGLILITINQIFNSKNVLLINKYITFLFLAVDAIIVSTELGLYDEWGVKMNYKAISYLSNPSEVMQTATLRNYVVALVLIFAQIGLGVYVYNKFIYFKYQFQKIKWAVIPIIFLAFTFVIGTGVRGGLQPIPINQSDVYFSNSQLLNVAAVNSCWNVIHSVRQNFKYMHKNPYQYMDKSAALVMVNNLYNVTKDTTIQFLTTQQPNIVLVILESWSSDMVYGIDSLHLGITPTFDSLARKGILFTNCYASGYRSDQGIVAIFSGFPAQPTTSIIKQPSKIPGLYSIKEEFKKHNYHTSFHFGGQLTYGNIKAYLYQKEFDKIYEQSDFPTSFPTGRLGVHDEFLFQKFVTDVNQYPEPFFASAFTLSSHAPYDQPMEKVLSFKNEEPYANSVHYTDKSIHAFIENAKQQKWYNNTLFIFVADHSHMTPIYHPRNSWEHKKIPMLFYGEVLKDEFKGTKYTKVVSQTDLPKTLLAQLNFDYSNLKWSKNMFNPHTKSFAYNSIEEGPSMVFEENQYSFDHVLNRSSYENFKDSTQKDSLINLGKAHLQILFDEYLNY